MRVLFQYSSREQYVIETRRDNLVLSFDLHYFCFLELALTGATSYSMAPKQNSQAVLSSFFSPSPTKSSKRRERPASPIDLTSDADGDILQVHTGEPPIKKIKVVRPSQSQSGPSARTQTNKSGNATTYTQSTLFSQATSSHTRLSPFMESTGMADQWAFTPHSSSAPDIASLDRNKMTEADKAKRHEAFKKKLLADDSRFKPRPSEPDKSLTPLADEETQSMRIHIEDEGASVNEDSRTDPDNTFEELMSVFSHSDSAAGKGKGRQKGSAGSKSKTEGSKRTITATATSGRSKKLPPKIGPSGEAYTPLELQVRVVDSVVFLLCN
jgi:DNA mismatch repair protein MSH3